MNTISNTLNTASLTVSLIQMDSGPDKAKNIQKALSFCDDSIAQDAKLICLPEIFHCRGHELATSEKKEPLPGPSLTPFMDFAKKHNVWILAGSVFESVEGRTRAYNTSCLIDPKGKITATYRKIHLFDVNVDDTKIMESASFIAGESPVVASIDDKTLGMSVCYDLRFPELYRHYAKTPVDMISIPASFTKTTGTAHWHPLIRARAIENQCFVLAPNQVGRGAYDVETYGHSMIVDPWGEIIAEGSGDSEEIVVGVLDFDRLNTIRSSLPALKHSILS